MNRFVLKNTFIKIYIYHFSTNIFIKIRSQSYALETVSLSKTTLFLSAEGVLCYWCPFSACVGGLLLQVGVSESTWQELEEELIPSSSIVRTNWLDTQPMRKYKDSCICVAGGNFFKIKIHSYIWLNLKTNHYLELSGIQLRCGTCQLTNLVQDSIFF
jgi:hypothetical protein